MSNYYNEIDPYAADWLRNLITAGHIAPGIVDERSIEDVHPSDLRGFTQCHFFAGIGVWSLALRRAGWPDDRSVWTGSCPCQPFSQAGAGAGFDDERHLWPAFFHLIGERRPPVILGEQVASKDVNPWIDLVQDDLEGLGYGVGAIPFPSAGVGAPHIRDRLYWVAQSEYGRRQARQQKQSWPGAALPPGAFGRLDNTQRERFDAVRPGDHCGHDGQLSCATGEGGTGPGPTNGLWRDPDWLFCRDGRWRPVEPGTFPLAHGAPARVGRLRAYGNAINATAAQAFIECAMDLVT